MDKKVLWIIVVAIAIIGGYYYFTSSNNTTSENVTEIETEAKDVKTEEVK